MLFHSPDRSICPKAGMAASSTNDATSKNSGFHKSSLSAGSCRRLVPLYVLFILFTYVFENSGALDSPEIQVKRPRFRKEDRVFVGNGIFDRVGSSFLKPLDQMQLLAVFHSIAV